jgi:hypothetical protein
MLVDGIGAALLLKERDDELVEREEIARVVRELMEGEEGQRKGEGVVRGSKEFGRGKRGSC